MVYYKKMVEKSKKRENKESNSQEEVLQILELIKGLRLSEINELNDRLKETFGIDADFSTSLASSNPLPKEEKEEEAVGNVSLKITGLSENATNKLSIYKFISDIAKEFGNDMNIIQAKRIVDEQNILLNNINIIQAKEIKSQLESRGVNVSITSIG